ncbi:hypothetical protein [Nocardioides sp. KR10-350]|uniref:hypothetical protein n=1 Tax=Nocardioides cheoyonin TaxID=3156615 RepID=UPI0032B5A2F4
MDTVTSEAAGDPMTASAGLPLPEPVRVSCFAPVVLPAADRPVDLSVKVTYPETGEDLPVILLSHGHGGSMYLASMYGYEPLTLFWAAHGFVVIQPNHLDANFLGLRETAEDPDRPLFLRHRATDMYLGRRELDGKGPDQRLRTVLACVPRADQLYASALLALAGAAVDVLRDDALAIAEQVRTSRYT